MPSTTQGVFCCLLLVLSFEQTDAASLRLGHRASAQAKRLTTEQRRCKKAGPSFFQQVAGAANGTESAGVFGAVGVFSDGYSRVGCETDIAPESERLYFDDNACGGVKTCRLTELPMEPRLCFDFCRQYEFARFFGIIGGKCYCSTYFHPDSTGGGDCSFACEGAPDEKCGGPHKSSLFEMHMCSNSMDEAGVANQAAADAKAQVSAATMKGADLVSKLRALTGVWQLGVCSVKPEGERVCSLTSGWNAAAGQVGDAVARAQHASDVLNVSDVTLGQASVAVEAAGEGVTADAASKLELGTMAVRDASAKAVGEAAAVNLIVDTLAGPIGGSPLENFDSVFSALGDLEGGYHALCALVAVKGESYMAAGEDDPAACARHCLSLSGGTDACMAFNYQYKNGLVTCQMLTADGIVDLDDALVKAVPIFEVSNSQKSAMGVDSLDCYASGRFIAGHPQGPLKTKVVRAVEVGTAPAQQQEAPAESAAPASA